MVNWCPEISLSKCGFCGEQFETPDLDKLEGWFYISCQKKNNLFKGYMNFDK